MPGESAAPENEFNSPPQWISIGNAAITYSGSLQAEVEPFDVSMHLLVELLGTMADGPTPVIERLVQQGRFLGLIRPSTRVQVVVPAVPPYTLRPALSLTDLVRRARYAQRNRYPRTAPFLSRFTTQLLI